MDEAATVRSRGMPSHAMLSRGLTAHLKTKKKSWALAASNNYDEEEMENMPIGGETRLARRYSEMYDMTFACLRCY